MTDYLRIISQSFRLSKKDTHEFDKIKIGPMTIEAESFMAAGLGHVSVMSGKAMLGLMKMDTLVINPFEKDMPLFSVDRMSSAGKEILLIEMYETRLNPVPFDRSFHEILLKCSDLPDCEFEARWYDTIRLPESVLKKGKKKDRELFFSISKEYLEEYIGLCIDAVSCDAQKKMEEAKKYSDGLLNNGGACTDLYVKQKGKEFTENFFRKCMFGA